MQRQPNPKAILAAVLVGLAAIGGPRVLEASPDEKTSCEVCHSKVAATFSQSAHAAAHMTCISCHGGDPNDMAVTAMSHGATFKGKPSRALIPQFCASCHSNVALMKQYGLGAHQFEDYKTSRHGLAWA